MQRISRRQRKRLYHSMVLLVIGCLFTLMALLIRPFHSFDMWLSDQLFISEPPSPNIVIAGIDDSTLETYGRWAEWSRGNHAQAIDNLSRAGAKVIGYDVVFIDSSPDDEMLASVITNAGNVVLANVGVNPEASPNPEITYDSFLLPADPLRQAASDIGHANVVPDADGVVRRLPLIASSISGQTYPSLSVTVLHRLFSMPLPSEYQIHNGKVKLLARDVPIDPSYNLRINYAAENAKRPYVSYGDIISGNFDSSVVNNKIVLIGMTATAEPDTWAIPTSASKIPGVFIHAAAIDTILTMRFLTDSGTTTTLITMLLLTFITAFALPWCGTRHWTDMAKGAGITAGLFIIYLLVSFFSFDRGYSLDLLYPLLLLPLVYVGNVIYMAVIEQSDKRFVKELFGRYISPQIAQEIVERADAGLLELGGEEREVTVLFADIRNFTRISEQLSPEATMRMLNAYLSVVADAVVQHQGIVNKFLGDDIMAVWNAPQTQQEHPSLAVRAACEAQQKITALRESDPQLPPVRFGIGINTGRVSAGNLGSKGRAEYTVIGDAVNVASRICGVTPGGEIWIGAETYNRAKEYLEVEELEQMSVKGKAAPIVVYKVTACRHIDLQNGK